MAKLLLLTDIIGCAPLIRLMRMLQFPARSFNSYRILPRTLRFYSSQLLISTHNETLSVAALGVHNPDCSPLGTNG
jgi:hypothetical protein